MAYHATIRDNVLRIKEEGLRIPEESSGFHLGKGLYFHTNKEWVCHHYGDWVVETEIELDPNCKFPPGFGLGTFDQFLEEYGREFQNEFGEVDYEQAWREYQARAQALAEDELQRGCKASYREQNNGIQIVIYDEELLKKLRFKIEPCKQ